MANKKLGRPTKERMHILRNQVSELLWFGQIETTVDRAKEVRRLADKMITLAVNNYNDTVKTTKVKTNLKGEKVEVEFTNDGVRKLAARRKMMAVLRDIQEAKLDKESKSAYAERTRDIKHPLVEKMFNVYGPKYAKRAEELGQGGGYTRVIKMTVRRGDNADRAIVQLVD